MSKKRLIAMILAIMLVFYACNPVAKDTGNKELDTTKDIENAKDTDGTEDSNDKANIDNKEIFKKHIERVPSTANFANFIEFQGIKSLPQGNPNETFEIDIRSIDISSDDVMNRLEDLLNTTFDSKTKWPENLPKEFNPEKVMELYKDPGLGVRELHKMGITGKGVGIAIIDQTLLVDHVEYKDNLKFYEEYGDYKKSSASMHGCAVASIAVGKTVGVAPDADLYYIAGLHGDVINGEYVSNFTLTASYIDRILEINEKLPIDKKIRVISISRGWGDSEKGYTEVMDAVKRANEKGIFVVSSSLAKTNGYNFHGLGKKPLSDSNDINSFIPGSWWKNQIKKWLEGKDYVMAPMDFRCTASPTGQEDYAVYQNGGWSWTIPYLAGTYALACQASPEITYDEFWETALSTGDTVKLKDSNDKDYDFGKIINPVKLIEEIKKKAQ